MSSYVTHGSSRRCFRRDDESGLTTLEWLLIVAAVAGLAALAVVLVTNVVDDTAEQISGSSARVTAATLAAQQIMDDAVKESDRQPNNAKKNGEWVSYYTDKCNRLRITYGDAGIQARAQFRYAASGANAATQDVVAITSPQQTIESPSKDITPNTLDGVLPTGALAFCGISQYR